jgi:hypothetical protein
MQGTKALCDAYPLDDAQTPLLLAWMRRSAELEAAKLVMPNVHRLVEFVKQNVPKLCQIN